MNSNYKGKVLFQLCWNQNWLLNVLVLEPGILGSCSRFLKSHDGAGLETQVSLEVLSDLTDQTLEWQFADQKLSGLLVTTDLTESDCSGTIPMRFLDSSGGWCRFTGSLGGQLFTGGFASGGLTGGLLGTSHVDESRANELKCSALLLLYQPVFSRARLN